MFFQVPKIQARFAALIHFCRKNNANKPNVKQESSEALMTQLRLHKLKLRINKQKEKFDCLMLVEKAVKTQSYPRMRSYINSCRCLKRIYH